VRITVSDFCECVLDIIGSKKDADSLRSEVMTAESTFDFNAIVPMPAELREAWSCSLGENAWQLKYGKWKNSRLLGLPDIASRAEAVAAARQFSPFHMEPGHSFDDLADAYDDRRTRYGYGDGYSWASKRWGTKWPAGEVEWMAATGTPGRESSHTVYFETAYAPPLPVIATLSSRFPDLNLRLAFSRPADQIRGFQTFTAGRVSAKHAEWFDYSVEWRVSVSHHLADLHDGIYIGDARSSGDGLPPLLRSKWANPFVINGRTPTEAIDLYARWLAGNPEANALLPPGEWHRPVYGEICDELRGELLVCGCPRADCTGCPCHGFVLARIAGVGGDEDQSEDGSPGDSIARAP
jgi:hypothetical protein